MLAAFVLVTHGKAQDFRKLTEVACNVKTTLKQKTGVENNHTGCPFDSLRAGVVDLQSQTRKSAEAEAVQVENVPRRVATKGRRLCEIRVDTCLKSTAGQLTALVAEPTKATHDNESLPKQGAAHSPAPAVSQVKVGVLVQFYGQAL